MDQTKAVPTQTVTGVKTLRREKGTIGELIRFIAAVATRKKACHYISSRITLSPTVSIS